MTKWSRHSRRIDPINLSAKQFCQGEPQAMGLSRMPIARTRRDPTKAQAIIAQIMAPNEKVEAYGLLPEAAVEALGLKSGEFRSA
jgi:hypothetical protein